MPKVICTRPNASLNINGVNFTPTEDGRGVVSDEISDDAAELFLSIEGYELSEQGDQKPAAAAAKPAAKTPAAPAKSAAVKKAAPTPAPVQEPAPETPAAPPAAAESEGAAENAATGAQDTDTGAGKGDSADDHNVF